MKKIELTWKIQLRRKQQKKNWVITDYRKIKTYNKIELSNMAQQ